jgi:phosphatidate cytidylyltransferase
MIMGSLFGLYMKNTDTVLFNNATILIILSGLLALLSQVGDLAESAVKRAFNVKNSGTIIPGHGGVMDRIDGVLFVAPAVLVLAYVIYAR